MAAAGKPSRALMIHAPWSSRLAASCFVLLLLLTAADALSIGVNYGQIANNLPPPSRVSWLVRSLGISKVKLFDTDPTVLRAFAGTGVEFVIAVPNENVRAMAASPGAAQAWLQRDVVPYIRGGARVTCIVVGNEVFKGSDAALQAAVLPAMLSVYRALAAAGMQGRVNVTTAHSLDVMAASFPPSAGAFRTDAAAQQHLRQLLGFLSATRSPFLINCYPFFAYRDDPARVPLEYALSQPNAAGVTDPGTGLRYDNMLYAQVDAVYAAIRRLVGHVDVEVKVSETGWPSRGDPDERGATPENAGTYVRNLVRRAEARQGTPMRPDTPVDVYVFALFNENLKPGPASERNYGMFYPDGTPVYDVGLRQFIPPVMMMSRGVRQVMDWFTLLAIGFLALVLS